ncbi:hypothetical protein ABIC44_002675 [Sphingomonas sp. 1185]
MRSLVGSDVTGRLDGRAGGLRLGSPAGAD